MQLTPMQEQFCRGVAAGLTAAEAARQAGFSAKYASAKSFALIKQPAIARRIEEIAGPREVVPVHPSIAELSLPALRQRLLTEAWSVLESARATNDRRSQIAALSLVADVTGMKSQALRVEQTSPLDGMDTRALLALAKALDAANDGAVEFVAGVEVIAGDTAGADAAG